MSRNRGLSFYKRRKPVSTGLIREIFSWLLGIVLAVFLAVVLNYFFGMSTNVVGVSMEPTLYNGQQILINRLSYMLSGPKAGDVVVFLPNGNKNSHYYVKRVVAVPGDRVLIQDGSIYVNGEICGLIPVKVEDAGIAGNELTLGKGEYFCIGDSPGSSEDSRSANIGPVNQEDIIGKAWFRMSSEECGMGLIE